MKDNKGNQGNTAVIEPLKVEGSAAVVSETPQVAPAPAAVVEQRTFACRIVPNTSDNAKAPIARCLMHLPGILAELVIDIPIFKSKDGNGISVMLPGGSFPAIRPANIVVVGQDGKRWETRMPEPKGQQLVTVLPDLVKTAYYGFLKTNEPEQTITFP